MVGVKRLINELKISQMPVPPLSPKKLFMPSETTAADGSQPETENEVTTEDLCIDTDKLASLKPVLMPEDVQDTTRPEHQELHPQESDPHREHLVPHQEQPCLNVVDNEDASGEKATDDR